MALFALSEKGEWEQDSHKRAVVELKEVSLQGVSHRIGWDKVFNECHHHHDLHEEKVSKAAVGCDVSTGAQQGAGLRAPQEKSRKGFVGVAGEEGIFPDRWGGGIF